MVGRKDGPEAVVTPNKGVHGLIPRWLWFCTASFAVLRIEIELNRVEDGYDLELWTVGSVVVPNYGSPVTFFLSCF